MPNAITLSQLRTWENTPIQVESAIVAAWDTYKLYQQCTAIDCGEPLKNASDYSILGFDYYANRAHTPDAQVTGENAALTRVQNAMFRKLIKTGLISQACRLRQGLLEDISVVNESLKRLGLQIVIMSGYRAPLVQLFAREAYELFHGREAAMRMFGSPRTGPHCAGGGCDIELADLHGTILPTKIIGSNTMALRYGEELLEQGKMLDAHTIACIQNRRCIYWIMRSL